MVHRIKYKRKLEAILNWMIMKTQNFWNAVKAVLIMEIQNLNADIEDEKEKD